MRSKLLIILILLLVGGCLSDRDSKIVNFSKVIEVAKPRAADPEDIRLRVAVAAMISPKETFVYYRELLNYIGKKLGKKVQLVQRRTYAEFNELLGRGEIDMAFICSGPYALGKDKYGFEMLATPEINGNHSYQAYLIVNERSPFKTLEDLRGKTFAFTDPDSNTGHLVPIHWIKAIHENPETFFSSTIYTYSHDNAIKAVARGLVDAASVDSLIWEFYNRRNRKITEATRIIKKSDLYGIPPLVTSKNLSGAVKERIRKILFSMHQDRDGKRILGHLMIDRFVQPMDNWYDSIKAMAGVPHPRPRNADGPEKP